MPEQDNIIPNTHYVSPDGKEYPVGLNGRIDFSKISGHLDLPNLVEIQTNSYADFVNKGIDEVFKEVFPILNNAGNISVEYVSSRLEDPTSTPAECREHSSDYSSKLKVTLRMRFTDTEEMKEKELYMGDLPKMTESGTFIINGTERVVVSQLVRSPGVYFSAERDKTSDKTIYNAKIIPSRGAWLEFETDKRDILSVRIDRKRKQPATLLLRALGIAETREEIIDILGDSEMVIRTLDRDPATTKEESIIEL